MKNEMWKMFELTGNIDSYLYYKSSVDNDQYKKQEEKEIENITTIE